MAKEEATQTQKIEEKKEAKQVQKVEEKKEEKKESKLHQAKKEDVKDLLKRVNDGNPDDYNDAVAKEEEVKGGSPNNLDIATTDMAKLIAKIGWWVGKWKAPKLYEGDELELKADGTFSSAGAAAFEDGSIWINLANGKLNLKRDQAAGTEEGMTKDYIMKFKTGKAAIVEDDDHV